MILVTGGTGFVGSHLLPRLAERGEPVRCLVRRSAALDRLKELKVEAAVGDVTDYALLRQAMEGVDRVIHLVAIIREKGSTTFERVNVQGTANVAQAAKDAGVKQLIHMSALGADPDRKYPYTFSKWQGEEVVRGSGLSCTIFRPGVIYGDGDEFITTLADMVRMTPVVPILGSGTVRFQPIWVEDVVTCFLKTLDNPKSSGQTYEIGGPEYLSYEQIVDTIIEKLRARRLKVHLPVFMMRPVVALMEKVLSKPPITTGMLALLARDNITDTDSVERCFGFKPQRLRDKIDYILRR